MIASCGTSFAVAVYSAKLSITHLGISSRYTSNRSLTKFPTASALIFQPFLYPLQSLLVTLIAPNLTNGAVLKNLERTHSQSIGTAGISARTAITNFVAEKLSDGKFRPAAESAHGIFILSVIWGAAAALGASIMAKRLENQPHQRARPQHRVSVVVSSSPH